MKKIGFFLVLAIVVLLIGACENESMNSDKNYLSEIAGTYFGEFSIESDLKSGNQATADVTVINSQLQIHCYGELLDTTFVMDVYEHGDSVMLCHTGLAFQTEYGHMGNGHKHMKDMHNNQSEWQHHMFDDHQTGDVHYGRFSMKMNTFEFMFRMMDGNSEYFLNFKGIKN